ncbi:MAG: hypothetical protein KGJ07_07270 [Patescibacteria group bacterium]|nr:hypothetical protein [Patescibacteria group bacterium]MDE2589831.1 hypothetical protein [Patescibacteria group bacterium]
MPDVFVAPDEKKDVVMHKRSPLPSIDTQSQPVSQTLLETKSGTSDSSVITVPEESISTSGTPFPAIITNPHHGIPLFTSFWQNPQGVYFDTQESNEHILLFLREHFITNLPWIFVTLLLLFIPPVTLFLFHLDSSPLIQILPLPFLSTVIIFFYIIVLTHAFTRFLTWYYNISLITPKRILDIELKDLVYKKISATKISLVQDINYQQSGTVRTIFDYGDVLIQTAGALENFYINAAPRPETVVKIVEQLIGKRGGQEEDNAV